MTPPADGDKIATCVAKVADNLIALVEAVALAAFDDHGSTLDRAIALVELSRIERTLQKSKRVKRICLRQRDTSGSIRHDLDKNTMENIR